MFLNHHSSYWPLFSFTTKLLSKRNVSSLSISTSSTSTHSSTHCNQLLTSAPTEAALTYIITNYLLVTNTNKFFSVLISFELSAVFDTANQPLERASSLGFHDTPPWSSSPTSQTSPSQPSLWILLFKSWCTLGSSPRPSLLSINTFSGFDQLYSLMTLKTITAAQFSLLDRLPDKSVWMSQTQNTQN